MAHIIADLTATVRLRKQNRIHNTRNNHNTRTHHNLLPLKRVSTYMDNMDDDEGYSSDSNTTPSTISSNNHNNHRPQHKRRKIQYNTPQRAKWDTGNPANPNPNLKHRRKARLEYRELADHTHDNRSTISNPLNPDFINLLHKQEQIYEYVCHPNEAFLDIEQSNRMSCILTEQTNLLIKDQYKITPNDYINALCNEYAISELQNENNSNNNNNNNNLDEPVKLDWKSMGKNNAQWFLTIPPISFMNGKMQQIDCMELENSKAKAVNAKRQKRKTFRSDAPIVQPKKVVKQSSSYKTETKSRVKKLKKALKKKCESQDGVNPFEFLINPYSYSQTIENLFDLSFIIKEGHGQISMHPQINQPILTFISSAENTTRNKKNKTNKTKKVNNGQCILKLNPESFYNLINVYDIKESQIEREKSENKSDDSESENEDESEEESESESESGNENGVNRTNQERNVYNRDKEEAD